MSERQIAGKSNGAVQEEFWLEGPFLEAVDLPSKAAEMAEACRRCGLCAKNCAFLQRQGLPGDLGQGLGEGSWDPALAYQCSLCGLCRAVCPLGLDFSGLMLASRRAARLAGAGPLPAHRRLVAYEDRGVSPRYTLHALPEGCDTVLFPGCGLPGSRPLTVWRLHQALAKEIPALGVVLDCCAKPSHDLGMFGRFQSRFGWLTQTLAEAGVGRVLTACANCYRMFAEYPTGLKVESVYGVLAASSRLPEPNPALAAPLHDPCAARFLPELLQSARDLAGRLGCQGPELPASGQKTLCCGEGGAVGLAAPELAMEWAGKRFQEGDGQRLITYCSGCAGRLGARQPVDHILDLALRPAAAARGKAGGARPPFTYWNRLRLKGRLVRALPRARQYTRPPSK